MKTVFVTGASGFLGGHLTRALSVSARVVGLVRDDVRSGLPEPLGPPIAVYGDISDREFLERVLAEYEVDTVFHLAAQTQVSVGVAEPIGTMRANVEGTWNVLEACRRQKTRRVVVASSDKVYGNGPVPYQEIQALRWGDPYGTSKACADMIASSYAKTYGMSIGIARCGNLYGPAHMNFSTLIPGTILAVLRGERPVLRSDGTMKRDYLHVRDAVAGYVALAESEETGAFNFGSGSCRAVLDVVGDILRVMESNVAPLVECRASGEIQDQWLDCFKANDRLGWSAKVDWMSGLRETVNWYAKVWWVTTAAMAGRLPA
jgi:CDP-glucose 4,6-dehydratase